MLKGKSTQEGRKSKRAHADTQRAPGRGPSPGRARTQEKGTGPRGPGTGPEGGRQTAQTEAPVRSGGGNPRGRATVQASAALHRPLRSQDDYGFSRGEIVGFTLEPTTASWNSARIVCCLDSTRNDSFTLTDTNKWQYIMKGMHVAESTSRERSFITRLEQQNVYGGHLRQGA